MPRTRLELIHLGMICHGHAIYFEVIRKKDEKSLWLSFDHICLPSLFLLIEFKFDTAISITFPLFVVRFIIIHPCFDDVLWLYWSSLLVPSSFLSGKRINLQMVYIVDLLSMAISPAMSIRLDDQRVLSLMMSLVSGEPTHILRQSGSAWRRHKAVARRKAKSCKALAAPRGSCWFWVGSDRNSELMDCD